MPHTRIDEPNHPVPKIKLPDAVIRKPVLPGSNSWAHEKEIEIPPPKNTIETQPTNRDRYEDESLVQFSSDNNQNSYLVSKTYIQPAVPLINTWTPSQKTRAVTDPVQFRTLLTSKKPSVSQLKKKGKIFEFASSKLDLTEGNGLPHPNVAPKALKFLGVEQDITTSPAFSEAQTENLVSTQDLSKNAVTRLPSRQIQSYEVPVQHSSFEQKDDSSKTKDYQGTRQTNSSGLRNNIEEVKRVHHEISNGGLRPPKGPVIGSVAKKYGIVEHQELHASASFHGVIENAFPFPLEENEAGNPKYIVPTKIVRREPSGEILQPLAYTPESSGSVWGNEHLVDPIPPPFTPIPKTGHPNHEHVPKGLALGTSSVSHDALREDFSHAVQGPQATQVQDIPAVLVSHALSGDPVIQPEQVRPSQSRSGLKVSAARKEHMLAIQSPNGYGERAAYHHQPISAQSAQHGLRQAIFDSRTHSVFDHQLSTANSWAPSPGNDSGFSQPLSTGSLSPHWTRHLAHNSVPSPPASQQEYQRPSPLSAGLAQLDLTIHHHIDSVFSSLSRQNADRHDHVLDRILLRIDNFEGSIFRELKSVKTELKSIKKDISKLQVSVSGTSRSHESVSKDSQMLCTKIDGLEKLMSQIGGKNHIRFADECTSGFNADRSHRQPNHRRTESAHGSLGSPPAESTVPMPTRQQISTASQAASRSRSRLGQSASSNGSKISSSRSSAGTGNEKQGNEAWNTSLVELAIASKNKIVPDLRDHPAYRQQDNLTALRDNMTEVEEKAAADGLVGSGWYDQAYGRGF